MTSDMSEGNGAGFRARQVTRPRAQVEEQLKQAILRGTFGHGEKLPPETELAQQFGVSRPTLREALGALASAGLIRKVPGVSGGNFVNSVTPDSLSRMLGESMNAILRLGLLRIDEITEVRPLLEISAARWAASNRTASQITELKRIVERQRSTIDHPDIVAYDLEFHAIIGHASGNRLLAAFVSAVHAAVDPERLFEVTDGIGTTTVQQHLSILAAIEAGDGDRAAAAMSQHLDSVLCDPKDPTVTEEP
jgi:GntR family transcriptional repressor for pyruvate dehydrogenase complex